MKRGIIINNGKIQRIDSESVKISSCISDTDLNYYLLYWDKILIPTNDLVHLRIKDEEQLIKTGVIERPSVRFGKWSSKASNFYNPFLVAQSIVANEVINKPDSNPFSDFDFTIHQIGHQLELEKDQSKKFNSIKVELFNCLPVPLANVNFAEILDFKNKRTNELMALHETLDDFYLEIITSPDMDFLQKKTLSRLKKSINDLDATTKEKFKWLTTYDFSVEFNLDLNIINSIILDVISYNKMGMEFPIATAISALTSSIKINGGRSTSVENAKDKAKLSYLASASKKKILRNQ